jgi:hypothetical protein
MNVESGKSIEKTNEKKIGRRETILKPLQSTTSFAMFFKSFNLVRGYHDPFLP